MILSGLFGNESAPKVLLYLENYSSGYPLGIAQTFKVPVSQIQRQLERFELEGVLSSRLIGKTRVYTWNPRCIYLKDLRSLLKKAIAVLPEHEIEKYFRQRQRPRRSGKPLAK
ncbi:MAG: ArsR family transcriptional regulator [Proteobacteria bacterium]|nr:ArsR family transcriptional regulator [Pseudomonadota bacterium]